MMQSHLNDGLPLGVAENGVEGDTYIQHPIFPNSTTCAEHGSVMVVPR